MNMDTTIAPDRIRLTDGRFMMIDPDLYEEMAQFVWFPVQGAFICYAGAKLNGLRLLAHRAVAGAGHFIDGMLLNCFSASSLSCH